MVRLAVTLGFQHWMWRTRRFRYTSNGSRHRVLLARLYAAQQLVYSLEVGLDSHPIAHRSLLDSAEFTFEQVEFLQAHLVTAE